MRKLWSLFIFAALLLLLPSSVAFAVELNENDEISFVQPLTVLSAGNNPGFSISGLAKGDFNGDGALDIFAVGFKRFGAELDRHHWYVLLGNGDGTFQGPIDSVETTTAIGSDLQLASPNARDLDGDGKLDILMAWYTKKQVLFLKGNGNGTFAPPVASTLPVAASNIAIGDLNGDGKLDIVVNDTASSTIATALGDGTGKFASPASYTTHGTAGYLLLGDFSGDGKPDVVYSVYGSPNFGLFLNNGSGTLSASPLLISAGGKDVSNVTIGDYNTDGKLDVLVMGQGGNVANVTSFAAVLMRGNGNGTFQSPGQSDYTNDLGQIGRVNGNDQDNIDVDGDGKRDLIFVNNQDAAIYVALNTGSGFGAIGKWAASAGRGDRGFAPDKRLVSAFVGGDFNGDSKTDIATAFVNVGNAGGVSLILGMGGGNFASVPLLKDSFTWTHAARSSALIDANGDSKLDLVIFDSGAPVVRLGDGLGGFAVSGQTGAAGNGASHDVEIGDIDGDGRIDAIYGLQNVVVAINNGSGGFTTSSFQTPRSTIDQRNQSLGDFNGDGKLDIAVRSSGLIEIYLYPFPTGVATANATLTLSMADNDAIGALDNHIAAQDFDGDGKMDIVSHSNNGSADVLEFFKGNGNGTFADSVSAGSGYGTIKQMLSRDLDGDGKLDLIAAGNYALWFAKGVGNGAFFSPVKIADVSGGAQQAALVDFNGDGNADVVTGYSGSAQGIMVVPGKGSGTFGAPMFFARGDSKWDGGVLAGDLNGDGKPDIVSLTAPSGDDKAHAAVLLNTSGPRADLSVALKASRNVVAANTAVRLIATVVNTGTNTATGAIYRQLLPASSWTFVSAEASQGTCAYASGVVNCALNSIVVSGTLTVTVTAQPKQIGDVAATASVSSTVADPEVGDNGAGFMIAVSAQPPSFVTQLGMAASTGSVGTNANKRPVIIMPKAKKSPVPVSIRINRSQLPNGFPSTSIINVVTIYNNQNYNMTQNNINVNITEWTVVIPPDVIVVGPASVRIRIIICGTTCGDPNDGVDDDLEIEFDLGDILLYDPSGVVSDKVTGQPIKDASVTLYKVPGALPDESGKTNQCRTIDTRPGGASGDWFTLPAATLTSGVLPDLLFDPGEISPVVNPQKTNSEGRYGWEVAKGCWFIKVEATGYKTVISPLVGVPPAVTDLNIKMEPVGETGNGNVYLPLVTK